MFTSHSRGHIIEWDGTNWRYKDTGELDNSKRECIRCGKKPTIEGYDACLGYIKGMSSACCGHGVEDPYFKKIGGREVLQAMIKGILRKGGK